MPRSWRERLAWYGLFLGVVLALFHDALTDGFDNDGLGYVAAATDAFARHPWRPFLDGGDPGHPALVLLPIALVWRLLGFGTRSAHLAIFLSAALALTFARELALLLLPGDAPRRTRNAVGLLAPAVLLAHPVFAAYTVQYLTEIPTTAFTLGLLLAVARDERRAAAGWGTLVALTKLTGFLTVGVTAAVVLARGLLRREPRRAVAAAVAPHAAALGALAVYLAVKLLALRLPLTTFANNAAWHGPWAVLTVRLPLTLRSITGFPPWATGVWLAVLAVAGLRALPRRRGAPVAAPGWSGAEVGLLVAAVAAANVLLFAANWNFPQPRYLLPVQALILVPGVVALATLVRSRPAFVFLSLGWVALAVARWRSDTLRPLEPAWPRLVAALRMPPIPEMSLDVRRRVAFVKALSTDLVERTPASCVHGLYPTAAALNVPYGGYGPGRVGPRMLRHEHATYAAFREESERKERVGACPGGRYAVVASWDVGAERFRDELRADPGARLLRTQEPLAGTWAEVYALTSAAPAGGSPGSSR